MAKLYDCVVKVGEYEVKGEKKARWQNVGAVLPGKDGTQYLLLEKWFNPAGVVDTGGNGDSVLIRLMPVDRPRQGGGNFDSEAPF